MYISVKIREDIFYNATAISLKFT